VNCAAFEALAGDLVRDRLPIGGERDLAFAHAETCSRCALRLVDERALAADLRALALGTEGAEAPLRVEEAVVAAWRERRIEPAAAMAPRGPSGRSAWLWGAAAAVLLSSGVAILRGPGKAVPSMMTTTATVPSPPEAEPARPAAEEVANAAMLPPRLGPSGTARPTAPAASAPAARRSGDDSRRAASVAFASLDGTGSVEGLESAHVVRVELPPSALAALGWPVSDDGEASLVRADIVVAEDGVARAIRLVE
jgi:hypothetical protein